MPYISPLYQSVVAPKSDSQSLGQLFSSTKRQQQDTKVSSQDSKSQPYAQSSREYLRKHRRSPAISLSNSVITGSASSVTPSGPRSSNQNESFNTQRGRLWEVRDLPELRADVNFVKPDRHNLLEFELSEYTDEVRSNFCPPFSQIDSTNDDALYFVCPRSRPSIAKQTIQNSSNFSEKKIPELQDLKCGNIRPPMIRKGSGELVRPALRVSLARRPSSLPVVPKSRKAVHFQDKCLDDYRHFLRGDCPMSVSADSPSAAPQDEKRGVSFGTDESNPLSFEWSIKSNCSPRQSIIKLSLPIRVEKVYLSSDTKTLIGVVAVQNLAFRKSITVRFTLDTWKTVSEIDATFDNTVRRNKQTKDDYDQFHFNIKLDDQVNLEHKTMNFCVRYKVHDQEYWDNNNTNNFQVEFFKTFKPKDEKLHKSQPPWSSTPQPFFINDSSPIHSKNIPKTPSESRPAMEDTLNRRESSAGQQPLLCTRYNLDASISAAIQSPSTTLCEKSELQLARGDAKSVSQRSLSLLPYVEMKTVPLVSKSPWSPGARRAIKC